MTDLKKPSRVRLDADAYEKLRLQVLARAGWRCQTCGCSAGIEVHHIQHRSQLGDDCEGNLIALCSDCHRQIHATAR